LLTFADFSDKFMAMGGNLTAVGPCRSGRGVRLIAATMSLLVLCGMAEAKREPVLKQVDLTHSYYWRELYLPQLTTGPSSLAFVPDGKSLIYSMAGSLWRQEIGSNEATELTHPKRAYDYQPDASRDGGSVVFSRYDGNSIELSFDPATISVPQLIESISSKYELADVHVEQPQIEEVIARFYDLHGASEA